MQLVSRFAAAFIPRRKKNAVNKNTTRFALPCANRPGGRTLRAARKRRWRRTDSENRSCERSISFFICQDRPCHFLALFVSLFSGCLHLIHQSTSCTQELRSSDFAVFEVVTLNWFLTIDFISRWMT
jgi:hypothetical protein